MQGEYLINIIILAGGLFQGLVITIALLVKGRNNKYVNSPLILLIFIITIQIFFRLADQAWLMENLPTLYYISFYLPYLYGPLTYLYIKKSLTSGLNLRFRDLLHSAPFTLSILMVVLIFHYDINIFNYIDNTIYNISDTIFQLVVLTFYIFLSKREVGKFFRTLKNKIEDSETADKWFSNFVDFMWYIGAIVMVTLTFLFYEIHVTYIMHLLIVLPIFLFWVSYKALTRPDLFVYHDGISILERHAGDAVKYRSTGLNPVEADSILLKLTGSLIEKEPYLDPEISLEKLSALIDVPKHHLSQVINQKMGKNFNDLINEKRVEKARILLKDPEMDKYTIAAIAFESGFNSISSFNDIFKKSTGMTPSQYKSSIKVFP